jgi:hypothetical protein
MYGEYMAEQHLGMAFSIFQHLGMTFSNLDQYSPFTLLHSSFSIAIKKGGWMTRAGRSILLYLRRLSTSSIKHLESPRI